MGKEAVLVIVILILSGLFVYWFHGRIKGTREFALLHLIERISSKELTKHLLETELKEIIRERDDISKDTFDQLIEKCVVLDIDKRMDLDEFFAEVANAMSVRLNTEASVILKLLQDREKESSTVIGPGLAIPHILVEGEKTFDILLARCKPGIVFPGSSSEVHAVFVLAGTHDERNFHLRALAAIAQIAQPLHFYKKWIRAKTAEALRDTVLLGKRLRH